MGAHFSSKHYRRKLTMISKVAVLCVFATLAQAAPEAQWLGHAPVAYAAPDCAHSTQDLVAKSCHPVAKEVAINQEIEYEEVCEDVVSKHCGHPGHVGLIKREAEADPQHLFGAHLPYAIGHHVAPVAHPIAHHAAVTVKHECAEVTTKHCVQSPISVDVPTPITKCHVEEHVECAEVIEKLPKVTCEPVETTVAVAAPYAHHGFGYGYGLGHHGLVGHLPLVAAPAAVVAEE